MPIPRHTIVCTQKKLIAKDTYELRFTRPENWSFKSGQFILLDVPLLENPTDIQTRAYSIGSEPSESDILLAVKLKPNGRSSVWIDQVVDVSTNVTMQGPFGNFVLPAVSHKPYLFLATGAGLAPFRAQIRELLTRNESHPIDLIFGVRDESEVFWAEEFLELSEKHERFSFHLTLTRAPESWTGHRGRVQTLVSHIAPDVGNRIVYACGNPEMTKEVKPMALTEWGVPKQDLHVEGFI